MIRLLEPNSNLNYGPKTGGLTNRGDGQDTLTDYRGSDTISFGGGITKNDLQLSRTGNDMIVAIKSSADKITVKDWYTTAPNPYFYNEEHRIEKLQFTDGTSLTSSELENIISNPTIPPITPTVVGTNGNDTFANLNGNDVYYAKSGYDIIKEYYGNDTYMFNRGDQWDTITDNQGADTVRLGDNITLADLSFIRSGNNLNLSIKGSSDGFTVVNWFSASKYQLENVQLANGTTLTNTQVNQLV